MKLPRGMMRTGAGKRPLCPDGIVWGTWSGPDQSPGSESPSVCDPD